MATSKVTYNVPQYIVDKVAAEAASVEPGAKYGVKSGIMLYGMSLYFCLSESHRRKIAMAISPSTPEESLRHILDAAWPVQLLRKASSMKDRDAEALLEFLEDPEWRKKACETA